MSESMEHVTMSARVERAIRRDIVSGIIVPGERLRVAQLSTRYGVSHIPVREALRQLEGDRLVVIDPHKGAILREVTPKFVRDMHDTRAALETLLVRNAAGRITPTDADGLDSLAAAYEHAAGSGRAAAMVEANLTLHRRIAVLADNPVAADIMDQGWELVVGIRQRYGFGPSRIAAIIAQHRRLVDAIRSGDATAAAGVALEHCLDARDDLLARMEEAVIGA
ncbi:GntR family transcriptional regulator [Ancylobacter aquaticus]|uniref:GntR family transcriptional regulator n=1 Tax=Ancylobacter aquaticus TaxID=100 RepID=A0A4V2PJD3_ANCAQ|nr:GntR family transcriptional regulator [Ancylobacter aquaticus]TCK28036.1 GntR family transcriptional regulator [Ancylobacter aquaticus]